MKNIEKLIAQQKKIQQQIEDAKHEQARISQISRAIAKHPQILALTDSQIISILQGAVGSADSKKPEANAKPQGGQDA